MNEQATMKQPHFAQFATGTKPPGLLAKLLAFLLSAALFVLAFMFSVVALAVVAVIGIGVAGWFWWKTRALRRRMREQGGMATAYRPEMDGQIIEGEVIREDATGAGNGRMLN
jgi:Flp pilus assembly protein TadB